jgi:hypothetical protein
MSTGAGCIAPAAANPATGSPSHGTRRAHTGRGCGLSACPDPGWHTGRPQRKCSTGSAAGPLLLRHGRLGGHGGRTPTMLPVLEAVVACGSKCPRTGSGRAPHGLPCPRWLRQGPPVSMLVSGVRKAAGHPSGAQTMAIDTSPASCAGHQPSGRRSFRKQPDGQSADRSLQLPLLLLKAGLRAAALGRQRHQRNPGGASLRQGNLSTYSNRARDNLPITTELAPRTIGSAAARHAKLPASSAAHHHELAMSWQFARHDRFVETPAFRARSLTEGKLS